MGGLGKDANDITLKDIEDFLSGDGAAASAANDGEGSQQEGDAGINNRQTDPNSSNTKITETQAFAHRLKESTEKAVQKERENIAKQFGYDSYEAMLAAKERDLLEQKGLDPEEVAPVVEQIVKDRLAQDPRMQELEQFRQQRMQQWAEQEVAELKDLTGGEIQKLEDVPPEVIELWKSKGSLKAAYLELKGEDLIKKMKVNIASGQNRSTVSHMQSPTGNPTPPGSDTLRPFTQEEKEIYRLFNPDVTDEQLSKLRKNK